MKFLAILLSLSLLAGCASVQPPAAPLPPFADARFAPPAEPVGAQDLFTLSPAMLSYLNSPAFNRYLRQSGSRRGLVEALYSKTDLKLEYESSKTRTAAETYADRSGNCLSLVIMTAAFAKELRMPVRFRSVDVGNAWSRKADLYLGSAHVNVAVGEPVDSGFRGSGLNEFQVVDFIPQDQAERLRARELDEDDIVAAMKRLRLLPRARLDPGLGLRAQRLVTLGDRLRHVRLLQRGGTVTKRCATVNRPCGCAARAAVSPAKRTAA